MEICRQISAMEPLLPKGQSVRLSELTCEILKASGRLTGQVHSPLVLQRVADLVREMNCYYSNLIEGHKTIPRDIERAMQRDFSHDQTQRDNQQLSLAHRHPNTEGNDMAGFTPAASAQSRSKCQ